MVGFLILTTTKVSDTWNTGQIHGGLSGMEYSRMLCNPTVIKQNLSESNGWWVWVYDKEFRVMENEENLELRFDWYIS